MFTGILGLISAVSAGYSLVREIVRDIHDAVDNDHTKKSLLKLPKEELKKLIREEIRRER